MPPSSAQFRRPRLRDALLEVRAAVERIGGAAIALEVPAASGYTISVASTITLQGGDRVFVKAGRNDEGTANAVREGADLASVIGDLGPPLRGHEDVDGWTIAVYDAIEGEALASWDTSAIEGMARLSETMRARLEPSPIEDTERYAHAFTPLLGTWQALAAPDSHDGQSVAHVQGKTLPYGLNLTQLAELESQWGDVIATGHALQHGDIRRDNVLREPSGRLWLVDWTHKWTAPGWVDLVRVAPDIAASGGNPQQFPLKTAWSGAPHDDVNVLLAGLAGRCWRDGQRADVPGLPQLRPMQREQGDATMRWLAERL